MSSNKRTNWKYLQLEFLSILRGSVTGPIIYLALSPDYHLALNDDVLLKVVIPDNWCLTRYISASRTTLTGALARVRRTRCQCTNQNVMIRN